MREQVTMAILDAAEQVIATRGLEGASTAAIAERAGVAVGTLYNYFPDRNALIDSLFKVRREEMLPRLVEVARTTARQPWDKRLRAYLAGVFAVFSEQRAFMRVVVAVDPKNKSPIILTAMLEALVDILKQPCGKRSEDYALMIVGAMKSLFHARVEADKPFEHDADFLAETFLQGIGHK
jgi:AcrR family transcriptional regulator